MDTLLIAFGIYVITVVGSIESMFIGGAIVSTILCVGIVIANIDRYHNEPFKAIKDEDGNFDKRYMRIVYTAITCLVLATLTPDRDDALLIAAVAVGYEGATVIADNDNVQRLGGKTFDLLENWIDQQAEAAKAEAGSITVE